LFLATVAAALWRLGRLRLPPQPLAATLWRDYGRRRYVLPVLDGRTYAGGGQTALLVLTPGQYKKYRRLDHQHYVLMAPPAGGGLLPAANLAAMIA